MYSYFLYKFRNLSLLVFIGLVLMSFLHHSNQAFYTFWEEQGTLKLSVSVETHDLEEVLHLKQGESLELKSARYIQDHFKCTLNASESSMNFLSSVSEKGWTKLDFSFDPPVGSIQQIKVSTDCFLTIGHHYINSVAFALRSLERSYTLDQNRQNITVIFKE